MKIVILMGSPNKKGSTSILVDSFKKGAEENGHTVEVSDDTKLIEGKVLNRGISAESLKDWISGLGI